MMPVAIKGGYAFGAYNLRRRRTAGRSSTWCCCPASRARSASRSPSTRWPTAQGRRISPDGHIRSLGVAHPGRAPRHPARRARVKGRRSTARAPGQLGSPSPSPAAESTPRRARRPAQPLPAPDRSPSATRTTRARHGRMRGRRAIVCDATAALDPNDDGCADIVDLQATLVATVAPRASRPSGRPRTVTPGTKQPQPRTTTGSKTPDVSQPTTDSRRRPRSLPLPTSPRTSLRRPRSLPRPKRPRMSPRRPRSLPLV